MLAAAVHGQHLAGDEVARGAAQIGAGFGNVPGGADPHHRVRAGIGGAGLGGIDVPAVGLDGARGDAVDPQPILRPFHRHRAGQADHPGPCGNGMRNPVQPARRHHHDVDDIARAARVAPFLRRCLHHVPAAVQVGVDHRVPAAGRDVDGRLRELAAGAVDQNIHRAPGPDPVPERLDRGAVAHVQHIAAGAVAGVAQRRDQRVDLVGLAAGDDDLGAHARVKPRHRPAQPARAARDHRHLPRQRIGRKHHAVRRKFRVGQAEGGGFGHGISHGACP